MIFKAREISPARLAASLDRGRHLAPNQVSEAMLDAHVATLRQIDGWGDDALQPTEHLADLIHRNIAKFATPDTQAQLSRCAVFVVPLPYCGAYSESPDTIVIGSGFIDYLAAYLYWGAVVHALPEELSNVRHPDYPQVPVLDLISVLLIGLLYRYLQYGDPLPNYRTLSTEDLDEKVRHSLSGALAFIVLHELGHLLLGHHDDDHQRVRMVNLPFQVPEDLSTYKLQELEADSFAREAMVEDYRPVHHFWMNAALGPHFVFETLLSSRDRSHPICINRLVHAQHSAQDTVDRTAYLESLERSVGQFQSIEAKNRALGIGGEHALLERMTRERLLPLLHDLNTHLEGRGIDLTHAMTHTMQGWESLFAPDTPD